jgi:hypothetical protein
MAAEWCNRGFVSFAVMAILSFGLAGYIASGVGYPKSPPWAALFIAFGLLNSWLAANVYRQAVAPPGVIVNWCCCGPKPAAGPRRGSGGVVTWTSDSLEV